MKTLGTSGSCFRPALQLAASMALLSAPAMAAPELSMTRSDGSEVIRTGRVVTWGEQIDSTIPAGTAVFENVVSISGAYKNTVAIRQDGTVGVVGFLNATEKAAVANLTGVRAAVKSFYAGAACKTDGTAAPWATWNVMPSGLTGVTNLSAGFGHMLALKDDGSVVAWGTSNLYGQAEVPAGLGGVVAIDSSNTHNVALKSDGTVFAWGENSAGQSTVPAGLTGVAAVSAGEGFTVALKNDGSLTGWGSGTLGQLTPPANLGPVTAIATGAGHTAALKPDGTVAIWGSAGSYGKTTFPPYLGRVSAIASGNDHLSVITHRPIEAFKGVGLHVSATKTFTIHNTGSDPLHLGNVLNTGANAADFVLDLSDWEPVLAPGESSTLGVTFTPAVWGLRSTVLTIPNDDPDEGDWDFALTGYAVNSLPVAGNLEIEMLEDSPNGVEFDMPAMDPNGDPLTFGIDTGGNYDLIFEPLGGTRYRVRSAKDFHGQKTFRYNASDYDFPPASGYLTITVIPVNDPPVLTVPAGPITVMPSSPDGAHVSFMAGAGDAEDGLLQPVMTVNGSPVTSGGLFPVGESLVEVSVTDSGGTTVTKSFTIRVVASPQMTLQEAGVELKERRLVSGWGFNDYGQTTIPSGVSEVIALAAGGRQSMVVLPDGTVRSWGSSSGVSAVPAGLTGVIRISTGGSHALALKSDGTVVGWGANGYGQATIPAGLAGVVAIATGDDHSLALKSDGTVVAWGNSTQGQTTVPAGLEQVVAVAASATYSMALRGNGSVAVWGSSYYGTHRPPVWLAGVVGIAAGGRHCLAWRSDGSLVGWGSADDGMTTAPAGLGPVISAAASNYQTTVIQADGTVRDWGRLSPLPAGYFTKAREIVGGYDHFLLARGAPALCSWGSTTAFGPAVKTLTISNSGTATLNVSGVSVEGGLPGEFVTDTGAMDGSLAPGESTSFTVTFSPKAPGLRQATLRIASDESAGETREVLLSGTWVNSPPVVTPVGPLTLDEDQPGGIEITLPASDSNGNALSFVIVSPPTAAQGALGPVSGNKVTFFPKADFHGSASFTFKANDGFVDSNTATVSLTVLPVNDPPRLTLPAAPVVVPTLSPDGAIAEFIVAALDVEGGWLNPVLTVAGVPVHSGSFFPMGETEVVVTATDSTGLTTTSSFIIRIEPGPDLVIEAPSGVLPQQTGVIAWGRGSSGQTTIPASLGPVIDVAGGNNYSIALRPDGTVAAWGSNTVTTVPAGLSGVVAISAGHSHAMALKDDGSVIAWGSNLSGEITVPAGLGAITAVAAGGNFSLALKADGTVTGWGINTSGQISIPAGLSDVVAISAGSSHSLALKRDGTVVAWGANTSGQAAVPAGLSGVKSVSAGDSHSVALRHDGTVVAWGSNTYGQTTIPAGLAGVKKISAGAYHTLALTMDRALVAWGRNNYGQRTVPVDLGWVEAMGAGYDHSLAVVNVAPPVDLGVAHQGGSVITTLTLRNDGPGDLVFGQASLTSGDISQFSIVEGVSDPVLSSAESTTLKVAFSPTSNGSKRAILTVRSNNSDNPVMQVALLGHGRNGSPVATNVTATGAEDPANGITITMSATDPEGDPLVYRVVSTSEALWQFGSVTGNTVKFTPWSNFFGTVTFSYVASDGGTDSNVATGTITVTSVNDPPVIDYMPSAFRVTTPLTGGTPVSFRLPVITDVENGSIAPQLRLSNGTVVGSGSVFPVGTTTVQVRGVDTSGSLVSGSFQITVESVTGSAIQLESPGGAVLPRPPAAMSWINSTFSTDIPVELRGVKEITASPGSNHGIALRNDGTLLGWGPNSGVLNFPVGLVTATKVRTGSSFALALKSDGTMAAWGSNTSGQTTLPTGLTGVTDIAAGGSHSVACKSDGTVVAWGANDSGQRTVPAGLTGVTAVAAGTSHTLALKADGTVTGWGSNSFGQRSIPASLSGVIAIAAGSEHSLALRSNGTVAAWGRSSEYQTFVPVGLSNVVAISAGPYHSIALKADGSVVAWGSYSWTGPRITSVPAQVSSVRSIASGNTQLMAAVDHPAAVALGTSPTGSPVTREITVRNRGNAALTLTGITRISGSADFTVQTSSMAGSVASGQTTTFTIAFHPTSSGPQSARFRIASNDRYETSYDITVSGEGVPPFRAWAATAGLGQTGVNPEAAPFGDGIASLLKYAFNMNGAGADVHPLEPGTGTSGLPVISLREESGETLLQVEFLRRRSGDLEYVPTRSSTLDASSFVPMTAVPEVTPVNDDWERVVVREPVDRLAIPHLFARVEVRMR